MNPKVILLLATALIATVSVFTLYWLFTNKAGRKNGFNRIITDHVDSVFTIDVKSNGYYFAGFYNNKCYLGNSKKPFNLLEIADTSQKTIKINSSFQPRQIAGTVIVDPPYFYMADPVSYKIYKGDLATWTIRDRIHNGKFFAEALPISSSTIVLRSLHPDKLEYLLSKESSDSPSFVEAEDLLQKQIDGMFCTDGILQFDKKEKLIVYTYFYRNQFICADTSLKLKYRGKTIDTISVANIKVSKRGSNGEIILASPPGIVNRRSYVTEGKLFLNSNLIADNENIHHFKSSDVIDIYNLSDGEYEHSFYLPKINDNRLNHFAIHNNLLYSLHGRFLTIYRFRDIKK